MGILISCQTNGGPRAEGPFLKLLEQRSGLISFLGPDGNVRVINQAGGGNRALTSDAGSKGDTTTAYAATAWSPDGKQVAFARFTLSADTVTGAALFTAPSAGGAITQLFFSSELQPFYINWSQDSRRVSVLSQVKGTEVLELGVATAGKAGDYVALDRGAPYYWNWLADSGSILAHANAQRGGNEGERLSLITLDPAPTKSDLPVETALFQAPDTSPDGKSIGYVMAAEDGFTLLVRRLDDSTERTVATDKGVAYFSFAPDGKHVAYLAALSTDPVPQGILKIVSLGSDALTTRVAETPVLAFFWAPDGKKLAYIVPDATDALDPMFQKNGRQLDVKIVGCDAATGKTWDIAVFPVTRGTLSILPFFDQYQRSATIWSPDGRYVVFTALSAKGEPALYVSRADGTLKPRFLTDGDYAFWSGK
jgi:Tol biopolymer transport system component